MIQSLEMQPLTWTRPQESQLSTTVENKIVLLTYDMPFPIVFYLRSLGYEVQKAPSNKPPDLVICCSIRGAVWAACEVPAGWLSTMPWWCWSFEIKEYLTTVLNRLNVKEEDQRITTEAYLVERVSNQIQAAISKKMSYWS